MATSYEAWVGDFFKYVLGEWRVIAQAPVSFAASLVVVAAVMYAAARWRYAGTIATLEERLRLRDDRAAEYERKLQGATPDQARATIEELERKINALGPRRIDGSKRQTITAAISTFRGSTLSIVADAASTDASNITRALSSAFTNAGWTVQQGVVMGLGNPPPSGIGVGLKNPSSTTPLESRVIQAFRDAEIEFDVQNSSSSSHLVGKPVFDIEVIVTNRLLD